MSYGIYTQEGIRKGLIHITEDENVITYIHHNITRNYKNPEEKVQAEIFCKLVLWYKYPVEKIGLYVPVTDGSTKKQADIFVYNDSNHICEFYFLIFPEQNCTPARSDQTALCPSRTDC